MPAVIGPGGLAEPADGLPEPKTALSTTGMVTDTALQVSRVQPPMKSIAFFNNKGGVGKTTLCCNVAAHFAKMRKRVLVVDCDPQCNATQLILPADVCSNLYWDEVVGESSTREKPPTILDVLKPIQMGDSSIARDIEPLPRSANRFDVDLMPGHPRMSVVEDKLSDAWLNAASGDIGGLRRTNWCAYFTKAFEARYDYILFDMGPSLGSLNRTVLRGSDFFVTPMGCDIFSIVGVRNIANWLRDWFEVYGIGVEHCQRRQPNELRAAELPDAGARVKFAGYTVQQYITKSVEGERRPTRAFERILSRIPQEIESTIGALRAENIEPTGLKLGDVPHAFSLIPLAQAANAPILDLNSRDGLVGAQFRQAEDYAAIIGRVAEHLAANTGG